MEYRHAQEKSEKMKKVTKIVDDDDDEGRIDFSVALSPKTTGTRNNTPKQ